jgi:threonine dehydrogenase-like Zn-dependent dehydrogenase
LKAQGIDDIVVSEPKERRRALCEKLGARVIAPEDLPTPRWPHDLVDEPFDVVLECSGVGAAMESGLAQLKRAGTLVMVGAGMARPKFDPNRILLNELIITGAYVYDDDGWGRALDLLASGKMPNDLLVEESDYRLDQLLDAAIGLHEGELAAKAMVVPRVS